MGQFVLFVVLDLYLQPQVVHVCAVLYVNGDVIEPWPAEDGAHAIVIEPLVVLFRPVAAETGSDSRCTGPGIPRGS